QGIVDLAQDAGDHDAHLVGGRAGLDGAGPAIGLIGRRLTAAGENFRTADQETRIDAEGVANEAEHDDGADTKPAAAHWQAEAATTAHSAAIIAATVFDVVAAAEVIVTHGGFSLNSISSISPRRQRIRRAPTRHSRKISNPLINSPPGKNCLVRRARVLVGDATHGLREFRTETAAESWIFRKPSPILGLSQQNAATRLANLARDALTQSPAQSRAIKFSIKSIFTLPGQCSASRLFSPASPTASPESEYLSHGCVASRGVCKGAPH